MESKTDALANAPSYDEAMKCTTSPPDQMHPYPAEILQSQNMMTMASVPVHSMQPMMQQPVMHMQPPAPMIQTINVSGGGIPTTCQSCQKPLHTRVGYVSTCSTHCSFLLCCLFLCWICAPFVYCSNSCREPRLYCVHCGSRI